MNATYDALLTPYVLSDKASIAFECQDEFFIAKHLITPGTEVTVGSPILITVDDAASIAAFATYKVADAPPAPAAVEKPSTPPPPSPPTPPPQQAPVPAIQPPPSIVKPPVAPPVKPAAPAPQIAPSPVPDQSRTSPPPSSAGTQGLMYSVRVTTTDANNFPLSARLKLIQTEYEIKYGRKKVVSVQGKPEKKGK